MSGHIGVEGNEKADEVVKEAAERTDVRKYPERFTRLAHMGGTITERKWKEAKHWFKTENNKRSPI